MLKVAWVWLDRCHQVHSHCSLLSGAGNGTDLSDKDPLRQWVGTLYYVTMQVSSSGIRPVHCHCKQLQLHQGTLSIDVTPLSLLLPLHPEPERSHSTALQSLSHQNQAKHWPASAVVVASDAKQRSQVLNSKPTFELTKCCTVQVTTVGNGDIVPNTPVEEVFSCFTMITGVVLFGFAISSSQ